MYLKSLELHGFKSFPDRTVLKFNNGVSVIVGPNGSGKSNITDAMRWVLGELSSKNIRGSKMEDVIFAGSDDKKPMSFAEVSVTFDDSDEPRVLSCPYTEVTASRRLYRSGESEYFINKKKVRLRDIYELFMNTGIGREGYSIVGQGRIAEIISKKSDDRRGVFEESAGISKIRYKKTESEKKLAETESNIERAEDIENELASRVGPLERDSLKARQYLELYGEKKKVDVSLWLYDYGRLKLDIDKSESDTRLSAHELEMAEDSVKNTSAKIERLYEESYSNKESLNKNREEVAAETGTISDGRAEILLLSKEKEHSEAQILSEKSLREAAEAGIAKESGKLEDAQTQLEGINGSLDSEKNRHDELYGASSELGDRIKSHTDTLEALLTEQKEAENSRTELRVRLSVLENNISNQKKRSKAISEEISKYETELSSLDRDAADSEMQITAYSEAVNRLENEESSYINDSKAVRAEYERTDSAIRRKQAELDSLGSRITALERMREHFDGYNNSIRFIMNEARSGRLGGIRGPISYLIKVDEKYNIAVETALGAALQNIVTDDENAAKRSIEALKRSNAGRATFYPLTTIRAQVRGREYDGLEATEGFVGWGDELTSYEAEYAGVVKNLLARVAVYDNLDNATTAARSKGWRIRAVTLDGQQINAGGSFTGGQIKRDSGILSRAAQIEALTAERDKGAAELSEITSKQKELSDKLGEGSKKLEELNDRKKLINSLIGAEQKHFSETDGRRSTIRSLIESLIADNAALEQSNAGSLDDLNDIRTGIDEKTASITDITAKREKLAVSRGECELLYTELSEKINESNIRIAELSRDREALLSQISEIRERLEAENEKSEGHNNRISELKQSIVELELRTAEIKLAVEAHEKRLSELTDEGKKLSDDSDGLERQLASLRNTEKEQSAHKELVFISHSKNETKLTALKNDMNKLTDILWDDYELTYASAEQFAGENGCHKILEGERNTWQTSQNELKTKIKALGHVNVEAIEEYNAVKGRYDFIKKQLDDLRASRADLSRIINGIEEDMTRMFREAFEKINIYFGEVFRELFGGGHAEVILTDPDDVLNSGIEINAAPPGKTIKNLSLLSGGEQAFIAIALMFALVKVNPSPFCIFDEIEAALDEVNVARVGRYIKGISKQMQIIMISHRRGTMEISDNLYGVTMQQSGVSKVFTLASANDNNIKLN